MNLVDDKRTLRSAMLAWRGALAEHERRAGAAALLTTLRCEKPFATPAVVSAFWPIKEEIDIRPLMIELFNAGCQMALPVVQGRGKPLLFRAWRPGDPLEAGVFGTLQPSARREIDEVPLSEVAAAARIVVERAATIGANDLVRDAARLLGFARITDRVVERVASGVRLAAQRELIRIDSGKATVPD